MDVRELARKAVERLRAARDGLAEELDDSPGAKRVWVHPYARDDGIHVEGHWRQSLAAVARAVGAIMNLPGEDRPPWDPPLHPETAAKIKKHGLDKWPPKGKEAKLILGHFRDTQDKFSTKIGDARRSYGKDRQRLHREIVRKFLRGHEAPQGKPTQLFFAGGTASGKSTALRKAQQEGSEIVPKDAVVINPDEIKVLLPEYQAMKNAGDSYAASGAHEESSDIAKLILKEAHKRGLNVIVDGTGDSDQTKFLRKIVTAADRGYKVRVFMVDLPENVAIERMIKRAEEPGDDQGRYVPVPEVQKMHRGAAGRHINWRSLDIVDQWEVWSTNAPGRGNAVLAARGGKGRFQVLDDYEYGRITAKAELDPFKPGK